MVIDQVITDRYALYNADCIEVMRDMPGDSVHYSIFSPPFASLYTYSNSERDMGNSRSKTEFYEHFKFVISELYRIMMPGRLVSFHCMDIPAMKERDGFIGLYDFPGELIRMFIDDEAADFFNAISRLKERMFIAETNADIRHAAKIRDLIERMENELSEYEPSSNKFIYHSRVSIWKDPLIEATRTKALGLMHKQIVKDSAMCRQGLPDYLITLRKPGKNPEPIAHPKGFTSFIGDNEPEAPKKEATMKDSRKHRYISMAKTDPVYSHHVWRRYASPVWMDINQSLTLNKEGARDEKDERHICPLQLQVIQRGMELWTNPGDIAFSPFGGIGSEPYIALQMGRRAVAIEIKTSYFQQMVTNCANAISADQLSMF